MSLVLVFAATHAEARPVAQMMKVSDSVRRESGHIGPNTVELFVSGIGPGAARACARKAMESCRVESAPQARRPDAVLVIGLCGALLPELSESTLVAYSSCLTTTAGASPLVCGQDLADRLIAKLTENGITCERVVGITACGMAKSKQEKLDLAQSGAGAIDMESYEVIRAATAAGMRSVVLRVVSDALSRRLPDFNPALKPTGEVDRLRAARIALGSPILTLRLIASNRRAMRKLRAAMKTVLFSDCFS